MEGTLSEVSGHDMAATGGCLGSILSSIIFFFCILIIAIPAHVNGYVDLEVDDRMQKLIKHILKLLTYLLFL